MPSSTVLWEGELNYYMTTGQGVINMPLLNGDWSNVKGLIFTFTTRETGRPSYSITWDKIDFENQKSLAVPRHGNYGTIEQKANEKEIDLSYSVTDILITQITAL